MQIEHYCCNKTEVVVAPVCSCHLLNALNHEKTCLHVVACPLEVHVLHVLRNTGLTFTRSTLPSGGSSRVVLWECGGGGGGGDRWRSGRREPEEDVRGSGVEGKCGEAGVGPWAGGLLCSP